MDYKEFGPMNRYINEVDPKSAGNFLPLCGIKGVKGTCHNEFDKYSIALLYNTLKSRYFLYCFNTGFAKYEALHNKTVIVNMDCPPYRRLLAWRARRCAQVNAFFAQRRIE